MTDPSLREPRASVARVAITLLLALAILSLSAYGLLSGDARALVAVTGGYVAYDVMLSLALAAAAAFGIALHRARPAPAHAELPSLAVIIAAHDERKDILATLASVRAQRGLRFEVIVASDGSTDGMEELIIEAFGLTARPGEPGIHVGEIAETRRSPSTVPVTSAVTPSMTAPVVVPRTLPLTLLALPRRGKAAALNAALACTRAEVVVTLDADTTLTEGALAAMAGAFVDPAVDAASGFVYVRNARASWITRYQYGEYVKSFFWRMGLAELDVNLQVSGAFGALRTHVLRALGGFSEDSLVEDYEIIFALHRRQRELGSRYRVVTVPEAAALTDGPVRFGAFVRQRTRWFTGFLQTLFDYRGMIGNGRYGRIGRLMLPVKSVDALLPVWSFASLAIVAGSIAGGRSELRAATLGLLAAKWILDAVLVGAMLIWHRRAYPTRSRVLALPWQLFCALTEPLVFNWLRQLSVLQSYGAFPTRAGRWTRDRDRRSSDGEPGSAESGNAELKLCEERAEER